MYRRRGENGFEELTMEKLVQHGYKRGGDDFNREYAVDVKRLFEFLNKP